MSLIKNAKLFGFFDNTESHSERNFKLILSVLSGVLCFFLSPFSISSQIGSSFINLPISIVFPFTISIAYGWRYGLISALSFGAFYPFLLWPEEGFGNFLTTSIYLFFFTSIGIMNQYNNEKRFDRYFVRLFLIITSFSIILFVSFIFLLNHLLQLNSFYWSNQVLHSIDRKLTIFFAIKDSINFAIIIIFSDLIIRLPIVRHLLRLPIERKMRVNTKIFVSSIIASLLVWFSFVGLGIVLLKHNGFDDGHLMLALYIIVIGGFLAARTIIFFIENEIEVRDALTESEKSLKMQFDLMPSACIVWAKDMSIVNWNPAAEKIFGFTKEEVVGKKAVETIIHPSISLEILSLWEKLLKDGVDLNSTNENITKQGAKITCEWLNTPIKAAGGELIGVISMVQDVTESKAIEDCLEFISFHKWENTQFNFFDAMSKYLSEKLDFEYVLINRVNSAILKAQSVSYYKNGNHSKEISYFLSGTPCENVYGKQLCIYPCDISNLFPSDIALKQMEAESYIGQPLWNSKNEPIGFIALIGKKRLAKINLAKSILNIVANSISGEMERVEVENNLRRSEFFFKESQRAANIGSYITDFEKGYWESSEVLDNIFGIDISYSRTIPGWIDIIHPDDQEMMGKYLTENVITNREPFDKEYRIVRKSDGEVRWVNGLGKAEFDDRGKIISLIGTIQDITERKKAEYSIQESEEQIRMITNNIPAYISYVDKSLHYRYVNENYERLCGLPNHEIIGKHIREVLGEEYMVANLENIQKVLRGEKVNYENEILTKMGENLFVSVSCIPHFDESGQVAGYYVFSRDITEKVIAEKANRESQAKVRAIVDSTLDSIWAISTNYEILYVNEFFRSEFYDAFGISLEPGINILDSLPEYLKEIWKPRYDKGLSGEYFIFEDGVEIGDYRRYFEVSVNPIQIEGKVIGVSMFSRDTTARKLAEKALAESEDRFQKVAESAEEWFWEIDANGLYTYSNSVVEKVLGYSVEEVVGKIHFYDLFDPNEKEYLMENAFKLINSQHKIKNFINVNIHKDGHKVTLRTSGSPIFDINDNIVGYRGVDADITKEKEIEKALRDSEEKFRLSFKTSPDSVNINALDGTYIEVNEGFTRLTGYTEKEVIGKSSLEINIWKNPSDRQKLVEGLMKDGICNNLEAEFRLKDGSVKTALMSARIINIDNKPHILSMTRDITERKKYEDSLKTFSWAVEQSPASIVITDTKGCIEFVNRKFIEVTGYSCDEAIGNTPSVLKSGYTSKEEYKNLWDTILSGNDWQGQFCNLKKNGEKYWENALISPITNEKGDIIHFVAIKEDITEKRDQERKTLSYIVEAEERERNRFSQELHDGLGPILSTIKLFFQWLHQTDDDSKRDMIFENGISNLNEAIDTIREISNNLSPRTITTFGVNAALKNFISNINQTQKLKIDYESNIDNRFNKNIEIIIYRIVTELINNTLKYANASKVIINLNEINGCIKLQYTDDGIGFDYNKSVSQGKGIGLFNIIQRINTLDGTINVVSAIGKGVNIIISLPLESNNLV